MKYTKDEVYYFKYSSIDWKEDTKVIVGATNDETITKLIILNENITNSFPDNYMLISIYRHVGNSLVCKVYN